VKRLLSVILLLLITFLAGHLTVAAQASELCDRRCVPVAGVTANDGGFDTHLGASAPSTLSGRPQRGGPTVEAPTGPVIQYAYSPVCDASCHSATAQATANTANCVAPAVAVWVTSQVVGSGAPFTLQGAPECLTPGEQLPYDPVQLTEMVANYFQRIPLPEPGLKIAPADNAIVNFPEIVSADQPPATTFTVAQAPFPVVTITATVQWQWNFGDGTTLTTNNPGKAYDGTDPADDDGYVTHAYKTANKAWPLTVTSIWTATYAVQGVAGIQTVTNAVQRTTAHPLAAAEYGSVLTGN
jgi:hypothetical protein